MKTIPVDAECATTATWLQVHLMRNAGEGLRDWSTRHASGSGRTGPSWGFSLSQGPQRRLNLLAAEQALIPVHSVVPVPKARSKGWVSLYPRGHPWGLISFLVAYSYSTPQAGARHNLAFPVANFIISVF